MAIKNSIQDEFEYLDATQDNFSYKVQLDFEI